MDQSNLLDIISLLAQLPGSIGYKEKYLQNLNLNVINVIEKFLPCEELETKIGKITGVTPKFVLTSLYILKELLKTCNEDSSSNLISIQNQQKIKVLLQMVFSLGLTPFLKKGVNTALKNMAYQLHLLNLEELFLTESYNLMIEVVKSLIEMFSAPSLRGLIIAHLGDLLSALLQVIYIGELKKPVKNSSSQNGNSKNKTFVMTEDFYEKMVKDRTEFKLIYSELINNIYKPLVIKQLIILLSPTKSVENNEIIKPPLWLKKAISNQLTGYLISLDGVSLVVRAMCESDADVVDWKKVDVLGKLISTVQGNLSVEEFYAKIGPQVVSMLNSTGSYCIPLAKKCIRNIYYHNADLCNRYIFEKLFEVFIMCSKPVSENFTGTLVSENALSRSIDQLTKCFSSGSAESSVPISVLIKIIKIIYKLYMKVAGSVYEHKSSIRDLLIEFLHSKNNIRELTIIFNALIFEEPHKEVLEMNENLEFQFGLSGGIQVGKRQVAQVPSILDGEFQLEFETCGDCMLDLLSSSSRDHSKKLLSDLFVVLLTGLSDVRGGRMEMSNNPDLLSVDDLIIRLMEKSQKRVITIKLLSLLAENEFVMETIQEKPEIAFEFVKDFLHSKAESFARGKKENDSLENGFESDLEEGDSEEVAVALAVLDLMTINLEPNSDRWDSFKSLLTSIRVIVGSSKEAKLNCYCEMLFNRISTRGAVCGSQNPRIRPFKDGKFSRFGSADSKNGEIFAGQTIPIDLDKQNGIDEGKTDGKFEGGDNGKSEFDTLLEEIRSEDIPTRGHAIIQLEKLIRRKDPETLSNMEIAFTILEKNLNHEDTYVYLSAINALEALAGVRGNADRILETICGEYVEIRKDSMTGDRIQLKLGEILMRITRGLGESARKHKSMLINAFLFGTKSPDELVRASSLSNLGELLRVLGFNVGSIVQEVFACVKAIATTDKSETARRAAVMVIQYLLKGITKDSFMVLEFVIRDLYRSLLHIHKTDKDEVARLHAELAMAEINRIVESSVCEPRKLEKRIGILGPF